MPHTHIYWPMFDLVAREGPKVDYALLSHYIGALVDGCHDCRLAALDTIVGTPVTAGGFVAMIAAGVRQTWGSHALETLRGEQPDTRGHAAFADMLADNPAVKFEPAFAASEAMSPEQRRWAVEFATGIMIQLFRRPSAPARPHHPKPPPPSSAQNPARDP